MKRLALLAMVAVVVLLGIWGYCRWKKSQADAAYNRGLAYNFKGEYDAAIADLTKAIRISPEDANAYQVRGLVYIGKREYDAAIADLTKAIRFDPKYANAYHWRGCAYLKKGEYDAAIADYTEAIRINPEYDNAYNPYNTPGRREGMSHLLLKLPVVSWEVTLP